MRKRSFIGGDYRGQLPPVHLTRVTAGLSWYSFIVMRSGDSFVARTAQIYAYLAPEVNVNLLVYTPAEFEAQRNRRFLRQALQEEITI